jgi:hypothetical protein
LTLPDNHTAVVAAARAVLRENDRGGYTVPTSGLYPFQWNWDSAFVAMAFALDDVWRAYRELEMLAAGQWDDGMIAHITFHEESDTYFPGPDVWRTHHKTRGRPRTSGITQPPVFGIALRRVHEAALRKGDATLSQRSYALFHACLKWHRWWLKARDPERTGVVAILHNWETGSDNSPAWDAPFARVPTTTTTPVKRRDLGHVDAAMRPRDEDYQRYIHLLDAHAAVQWQPADQWRIAPFKIAEVQTTAILARATEDLIALSYSLGTPDEQAELLDMHALLLNGLTNCWREEHACFVSQDLIGATDLTARTHAGFVPLLALDLDAGPRAKVAAAVASVLEGVKVGFPTTPPDDPAFDAKRYWRGPSWAVMNWLLIEGLERNGLDDLAKRLRDDTLTAIARAGFAEYFDPQTGEGCGGLSISWTAAAYLCLSASEASRP